MRSFVTIQAKNLSVSYSELQALDIPALKAGGGVFALIGHNGAGKSTLIKTILGLLDPRAGSVEVRNVHGARLIPDRDMAFCPENGSVFADIPVEDYLKLWCRIKHGDSGYYLSRGAEYLDRLSLPPLLSKKGRELSKGQRRRVQAALGFMSDPKLFLFDEPFDGLDVSRTNELMEIVEDESRKRTFLISSHRMDVMERIADSVIVLESGELRCSGTVSTVCEDLAGSSELSLTDAMRSHLRTNG